jgi:RNA polymerase sigma-70 factor, ECF subfamily
MSTAFTGIKSIMLSYPHRTVADTQSDFGSFEELAMPLFARLYNFAHWLAQDPGEAEDLVQETCMKALKEFDSFHQGTNFRAWMYRILRNTFLTSRTGMKAATVSLDDNEDDTLEPVASGTPESILLASLDRQAIQSALEGLSVQYREVILLCDVEEMSYQEIALTLAIPIGTVMSRLSRARKAMRELLSDAGVRGASRGGTR